MCALCFVESIWLWWDCMTTATRTLSQSKRSQNVMWNWQKQNNNFELVLWCLRLFQNMRNKTADATHKGMLLHTSAFYYKRLTVCHPSIFIFIIFSALKWLHQHKKILHFPPSELQAIPMNWNNQKTNETENAISTRFTKTTDIC